MKKIIGLTIFSLITVSVSGQEYGRIIAKFFKNNYDSVIITNESMLNEHTGEYSFAYDEKVYLLLYEPSDYDYFIKGGKRNLYLYRYEVNDHRLVKATNKPVQTDSINNPEYLDCYFPLNKTYPENLKGFVNVSPDKVVMKLMCHNYEYGLNTSDFYYRMIVFKPKHDGTFDFKIIKTVDMKRKTGYREIVR
jgi:hypothetical protein